MSVSRRASYPVPNLGHPMRNPAGTSRPYREGQNIDPRALDMQAKRIQNIRDNHLLMMSVEYRFGCEGLQ